MELKNTNGYIYKNSREKSSATMPEIEEALDVDKRQILRYESGQSIPSVEKVCIMSEKYKDPALLRLHCTLVCPLGRKDNDFKESNNIYSSGFKLLDADTKLNKIKEILFRVLADGKVDKNEIPDLEKIIPQIKDIKSIINEIEVEIEKKMYNTAEKTFK